MKTEITVEVFKEVGALPPTEDRMEEMFSAGWEFVCMVSHEALVHTYFSRPKQRVCAEPRRDIYGNLE